MNTKLPDPNVVEQLLSAMDKHPFATLLMALLGLAWLLRKRN